MQSLMGLVVVVMMGDGGMNGGGGGMNRGGDGRGGGKKTGWVEIRVGEGGVGARGIVRLAES